MVPIRCAGSASLIREDAKTRAPHPRPQLLVFLKVKTLLKVRLAIPGRKRPGSGGGAGQARVVITAQLCDWNLSG